MPEACFPVNFKTFLKATFFAENFFTNTCDEPYFTCVLFLKNLYLIYFKSLLN